MRQIGSVKVTMSGGPTQSMPTIQPTLAPVSSCNGVYNLLNAQHGETDYPFTNINNAELIDSEKDAVTGLWWEANFIATDSSNPSSATVTLHDEVTGDISEPAILTCEGTQCSFNPLL